MKTLKDKYLALDYGLDVVGYTRKPVIVKIKGSANQHKDRRWVYFYRGKKKIGDCNPVFFKAHFIKS